MPTDSKNPRQSVGVISFSAFPIELMSFLLVRAPVRRRDALTLDHIFSIGLRSGEYGGRKRSLAPVDSMASATAVDL